MIAVKSFSWLHADGVFKVYAAFDKFEASASDLSKAKRMGLVSDEPLSVEAEEKPKKKPKE